MRDETLTLDVRDAVTAKHKPCTPHPVSTQPAYTVPDTQIPLSQRRLPLRHEHLEAIVMRFPGKQRVHQSQGFLQIVATVVFATRQRQRRRGRVVELLRTTLRPSFQVLFDPGVGFRNLDASCTAFRELPQRSIPLFRADLLEVRVQQREGLQILHRLLVQVENLVIRLPCSSCTCCPGYSSSHPVCPGCATSRQRSRLGVFPTPLSALSTLTLVLDAASAAKELVLRSSHSLPPLLSGFGIALQLVWYQDGDLRQFSFRCTSGIPNSVKVRSIRKKRRLSQKAHARQSINDK